MQVGSPASLPALPTSLRQRTGRPLEREAPALPRASPLGSKSNVQFLGAAPQRPLDSGAQTTLPGSCPVPPETPSTHCPSPHPDGTEAEVPRSPEAEGAWTDPALLRRAPVGGPQVHRGVFLAFSKIGVQLLLARWFLPYDGISCVSVLTDVRLCDFMDQPAPLSVEFSRQGSPPGPPPPHTAPSAAEHRAGLPAWTAAPRQRPVSHVAVRVRQSSLLTLPTPFPSCLSPPPPSPARVHLLFWTPGSFLLCLEWPFRSRGLRAGWGLGTVFTPQGGGSQPAA